MQRGRLQLAVDLAEVIQLLDRAVERVAGFHLPDARLFGGDLSASTSRLKSVTDSARSASTVSLPSAETSAKPPSTTIFCCWPPAVTVMMPGRNAATTGA